MYGRDWLNNPPKYEFDIPTSAVVGTLVGIAVMMVALLPAISLRGIFGTSLAVVMLASGALVLVWVARHMNKARDDAGEEWQQFSSWVQHLSPEAYAANEHWIQMIVTEHSDYERKRAGSTVIVNR